MSLLLFEHYRTATESLRRARSRTLLTISGVAIGVASITAILALTHGVTEMINQQVTDLGSRVAIVRPTLDSPTVSDFGSPVSKNAYTTSSLTERDLTTIQELKQVKSTTPLMTLSGSVRTKTVRAERSTILATSPSLLDTAQLEIKEGQFIDSIISEKTVVVGSRLAVDLYGTEKAVGQTLLIRGQVFTVIGVMKRQNNPVNFNNIDFDYTAVISLESGKLFNSNLAQIQQINVATRDTNIETIKSEIEKILLKNHDNEHDTEVLTGSDISRPANQLYALISGGMAIIAGVSLLVGGIGIMNIMLVSVTERTREIGLRKAVGSSNTMIITQFMIEALIISLLGGVLGYAGGYLGAFAISMFLPYDPTLSWQIAVIAFVLSLGVGIVFGLYPAIRAARKDPIESLRRYY
ncbi:MAG: ABC transporter permease [Candidatus Saccharimonadales bacterium]